MKALHSVAFVLLVIGGLNWGVFAVSGWEVGQIFGGMENIVSKIIYILVGLSALVLIFDHKNSCKYCMKGDMSSGTSHM